ncbi:MAG: Dabb family protein [Streptosporangiaceae bacterium]
MIRHVVLFRWRPGSTPAQHQQVATELLKLPPLMTGLVAYRVGQDAGINQGNFEFAVVADFEDTPSYLAYRDHPAHRAVIAQFITPILADRAAIQFEI